MELVIPPFNVNCSGRDSVITHIAVPDNFVDIQVLKCRGGRCGTEVIRTITQVGCEGEVIKEESRIVKKVSEFPVDVKRVDSSVIEDKEMKSGDYSISFGEDVKDARLSMEMVDEIEAPLNDQARIVGTPIVIKLNATGKVSSLPINITMPYTDGEDEIISIFAYFKDENNDTRWEIIGGEVDKDTKTVKADIDFTKYAGTKAEIVLGPIGLVCPYCFTSKFENLFTPEPDSKNAVVLVHGLFATPEIWDDAVGDIKETNQPWQLWTLVYPTGKSIEENAAEFAEQLEQNSGRYNTLYLIGHSLGGIIIQKALQIGYIKGYSFVGKVKVVITVGTPNDGSPVALFIKDLINKFVNFELQGAFTLHPDINDQLITGMNIPKIPGIEYHVIAGTKGYDYLGLKITDQFFKNQTNDGMVSIRSAQHIGDDYHTKECEDFWPRYTVHQDLPSDQLVRETVEKIIAKAAKEKMRQAELEKPILGYSNYYQLVTTNCSPEDQYIVIGRRVTEKKAQEEFLCSCGNGVCAGIETPTICPEDCAEKLPFYNDQKKMIPIIILMALLLLLILLRRKTFTDYQTARKIIRNNERRIYKKMFMLEESYNKIPEKERKGLHPIRFSPGIIDRQVMKTIKDEKIDPELTKLILAANKNILSRVITSRRIGKSLRSRFTRIRFIDPFKNRKV